MKNNYKKTLLIGLIGVSSIISIGQARVQAIHNCPDPGAATVDVWLNNTKLIPNFNYKDASSYIDAPAGTAFDLTITAANSADTMNAVFKKSFTLMNGTAYTVVASGGLAEAGATAFDLRAYAGLEEANNKGASETSVNIIHGSYDAPMVDIFEVQIPAGELAPDISFGEATGYVDLGSTDYDIQVRTQTGIVAAEFDVDITTLSDSAVTVLATGYLDPSSAVGTESFGLIAVLSNGTVLNLPSKTTTPARLQVIHNCAATDAASVDVYLNDGVLIDNFAFRTASAFIDAPAGENFDVSIALPTSMDTVNALFKQSFILESAKTYIVVASGTIGSGNYSPATSFSLEVITDARETSTTNGNVDVLVYHGSTDVPTVDVVETQVGAGTIVDNLAYSESAGYLDLGATDYDLDIRDESGTTTVASFNADITTLADKAITILASGFLDPSANNDASAFGLFVALPDGGDLLELSAITTNSINDLNNLEFSIAPNPANNFISISNIIDYYNYEIIDLKGNPVLFGDSKNNNIINISSLNKGLYFIKISNNTSSNIVKFNKL